MAADFDQEDYWISRHRRLKDDPRSVGNLGLSVEENLEGAQRLSANLQAALRLLRAKGRVLDLGCGYGRLAPDFCDAGLSYLGIDVSPEAVQRARQIEPRGRYIVGQALAADWGGPFDLIAAIFVLVHFVDNQDWLALLGKIAGALRPGGCLLVVDHFAAVETLTAAHARQRTLQRYVETLAKLGLRIDQSFPGNLAKDLGRQTNFQVFRK